MNVQGSFNHLFRSDLRKDFRDEWEQFEPEYPYFLRTDTMDKPEISATIMTGPSRLLERGDGESITYEDAVMGPKVSGVDKEFALGFMLTRKTVEDDQYGKANSAAKWLAHAARMTSEYRSAALLDDAFTGTTFLGIDGLALCHLTHTLYGNGTTSTVANTPSTQIQVSLAGFNSCMELFQLMKDWNGDPVKIWPDKLVIGNNVGDVNRTMAILSSMKEPFTAENQDNVVKTRLSGLTHEVSHYKLSSRSYFFISSRYNDAWYLTRRPVEFDDSFDFDTDAAKYKTTTRFLIWFVDWHGWVGVNPS